MGNNGKKNGNPVQPAQAVQAQADGQAELLARTFGLVAAYVDKRGMDAFIRYDTAAQILKTCPTSTKAVLDEMVALGAMESQKGGKYVATKRFSRVYAVYGVQ